MKYLIYLFKQTIFLLKYDSYHILLLIIDNGMANSGFKIILFKYRMCKFMQFVYNG